jgi:hypothetical protein
MKVKIQIVSDDGRTVLYEHPPNELHTLKVSLAHGVTEPADDKKLIQLMGFVFTPEIQ